MKRQDPQRARALKMTKTSSLADISRAVGADEAQILAWIAEAREESAARKKKDEIRNRGAHGAAVIACRQNLKDLRREHGDGARFEIAIPAGRARFAPAGFAGPGAGSPAELCKAY
jgi:hypothetical protein